MEFFIHRNFLGLLTASWLNKLPTFRNLLMGFWSASRWGFYLNMTGLLALQNFIE